MPVLYVNLNKHEPTKKEPYASFLKKFDIIKDDLDGEQIEIRVGGRDGTFVNGFYIDRVYYKNPRLKFDFSTVPSPYEQNKTATFIRATYSYDDEDGYDLDFHLQRAKNIKKRAPYYYLPGVTNFEFSSQIDDEYKLIFDVLVEEKEKVEEICCFLISQIISIFSLED